MDERYYIFGGLALLLLALIVYLIEAVARYRRAVRNARQATVGSGSEGEERYLTEDDRASRAFTVPAADAPGANAAPAAVDPSIGADSMVDLHRSRGSAPEPQPEPEHFATVPAIPAPAPDALPLVVEHDSGDGESLLLEEPSHPVLAMEPMAPVAVAPENQMDEIAELMIALGAIHPELDPAPEPEPAPAPMPWPALEPDPATAPEPVPSRVDAPQPGYSLADELERLMAAAESQTAFLPREEHEKTLASLPVPEPQPAYEAPPVLPPLSVGQALSAPEDRPVSTPTAEPEPTRAPASEPPATTPAYALVAPVELHFTGGGGRVGVKPGTRSYAEFQRLAGIMLSDLRSAQGR
ncbi:MAG: hypothetical protein ACYDHQ_08105 [Coriobacteriia bacterium]